MKALKILVLAIVGLVGLLLIIAAFLPAEYRIERSVMIEAHPEVVFDYVADFHRWSNWSPWEPLDPEADITISGDGTGVGAIMSWDGEIMGKGSLTFTGITRPTEVRSRLVFTDPYAMSSEDVWTLEAVEGGTLLTWSDEGTLSWPLERWFGLTLDSQLGPDFERGLANIKRIVELAPHPPPPSAVSDDGSDAGSETEPAD